MASKLHTLMFIDDDEHFIYLLKRAASKINGVKSIITASHGANAIDQIKQILLEQAEIPTVVFVDVNMPVMNGFEFLDTFKALREKNPQLESAVHIVMLSSSGESKDKELAMRSGLVNDYIIKQSAPEMKTAIERVLLEY